MKKLNIEQIMKLLESRFLNNKYKNLASMPKPDTLKGIYNATQRIVKALNNDETINIIGDYDADGVISTAIIVEFFNKAIGVEVNYIIPNRFEHGYGISKKILDLIYDGIVITVDNGISAIQAAKIAKDRGLDLIITDHHTVGEILPDAYAIINPKQIDCNFPFKDICGANVAWYLCASIKKELNLDFNLMEFFDILTIAIVADIMPMVSLNKTIVKRGLKELEKSNRPSICALRDRFGFKTITEEDIGFKIAPLINCAGRMEDASIALEFILSYDKYEANENLEYLIELNERRKLEQTLIFEDAKLKVNDNDDVIVVASSDWNEGIIGIVASKLCDKYKKPAIVFNIKGKIAKASARSVANINLYDLIHGVKDLTLGFGGHKGAAGLSLDITNLDNFTKEINKQYLNIPAEDKVLNNEALCELDINNINEYLYNIIDSNRPYGLDNKLPIFYFKDLDIINIKFMGKNKEYKKLIISNNIYEVEVLIFTDTQDLEINNKISFLASINKNEYNGKITYNLMLKEILEVKL